MRKSGSFAPALKSRSGPARQESGFGFLLEGGGVGRAVFVFGRLYFFAGLVGRNNPVKPAILSHGPEKEVRVAGKDRESGTEKVSCGDGIGFLCFTFLDLFNHLIDVRI